MRAAADAETPRVEIYKQEAGGSVWRMEMQGRPWVVKSLPGGVKTAAYELFRLSEGRRLWRGSAKLGKSGVRCIRPVLLAGRGICSVGGQWLVMPFQSGTTLADRLAGAGASDTWSPRFRQVRLAIARRLGDQAGRLVAAGIVNRDHKPSNLILTDEPGDAIPAPVMIDLDGLRIKRSRGQVLRMLSVLYRASLRVGEVTDDEAIAFAEAFVEASPSVGRAERLLEDVRCLTRARPLSYDPARVELPG